jgi:hypothetical protein
MRWIRHGNCVQLRHIVRCFERAVAVLDNGLRHPWLAAPPELFKSGRVGRGSLVGRLDSEGLPDRRCRVRGSQGCRTGRARRRSQSSTAPGAAKPPAQPSGRRPAAAPAWWAGRRRPPAVGPCFGGGCNDAGPTGSLIATDDGPEPHRPAIRHRSSEAVAFVKSNAPEHTGAPAGEANRFAPAAGRA